VPELFLAVLGDVEKRLFAAHLQFLNRQPVRTNGLRALLEQSFDDKPTASRLSPGKAVLTTTPFWNSSSELMSAVVA